MFTLFLLICAADQLLPTLAAHKPADTKSPLVPAGTVKTFNPDLPKVKPGHIRDDTYKDVKVSGKLGKCATNVLNNEKEKDCFLAGVASMKGYQDDDDTPENVYSHGRKHGDPFQCMDCMLNSKGIETWGCTVVELRSWCQDAAKGIMGGAAKDNLKNKKKEKQDMQDEIETEIKGGGIKGDLKAVQEFEAGHDNEVKDMEKYTDAALKKIFGKFDELFKEHPNLKKRAAKVMANVLRDEKKMGAFSHIDKIKDFAGITQKDKRLIG
jgi:hypothetical protein